ncbi:MAG: tannase/feruloyl esterase family alpha/beta hydrolase [Vicinamibacterales bacterium]
MITMAQEVTAGGFSRPATGPFAADQGFTTPVAFCRVAVTLTPTADSDIKIEVWMPATGWNGKFQAVGNGGWAGSLSYAAMSEALGLGYATSSTDTGHTGRGSGSFVLGHPEKYIDFAYRAVHEMTVAAKVVINAFYSTAPTHAYWNGCSTGGRQGLAEVQRYPKDFDGVIAGAQANPWTHLSARGLSLAQAALTDPAAFIPPSKYPVIHRAVLEACDALDGVTDGLISDPTQCTFDPHTLTCEGADGPGCLTERQVQTARTMMRPARTARGDEIFPGLAPGTELGWGSLAGGPEPAPVVIDHYKYVVFKDPNWNWRTFSLDRDVARADTADKGTINAIDPRIQPFTRRGGKLLMYHGWADPVVSPGTSVNYYTTVEQALGGPFKAADSVRLFMVPGMGHCRGGEGPNSFDMVAALERWVENGIAPNRIVASHMTEGHADRTRPLCPYPQVAAYRGTGSTDDEANFVCKAAPQRSKKIGPRK